MSTYVPIQAITLSASATSIEFTGIPQTFTDLVLVASIFADNTTNRGTRIRFNSDSGSNYSSTLLAGNGTSPESNRTSSATFIPMTWFGAMVNSTTSAATCIININNYSNTTTNKTALIRANRAEANVSALVGLWRNTNAINTITLSLESNSFGSNSTFTLYGVGSGSPKAFGGDEVRTDGTYWYHTFISSGRFETTQQLDNVDFLVIAGGGGGGCADVNNNGGGGGAGGYRTSLGNSGGGAAAQSKLSLSPNTLYSVSVGAGGSGGAGTYIGGSNGGNSSFATVSTIGGGGGGAVNSPGGGGKGRDGGSGGGSGDFNTNWTGGAGTPNEGFDGGSGVGAANSSRNMGGGGGAGSAGGSYITQAGGAGLASSITGTSVTRASGGNGSGSGGSAGANTGSGGNGNRSPAAGNGGSGIVIVRYLI